MILIKKLNFSLVFLLMISSISVILLGGCSVSASSVQLNANRNFIYVDETLVIEGKILPENASNQRLIWTSSNENIASVENGIVSGKQTGSTVITASAPNGVSRSVSIEVRQRIIQPNLISLNRNQINLNINETFELVANIAPTTATDKTIVFISNAPNVATVNNNGLVTAVGAGIAVITARSTNGLTANLTVTVAPPVVLATSISLNRSQIGVERGERFNLITSILPSNATNQQVTYSSSNSNIASVNSNGQILGVNEGIATISATTSNGRIATVRVLVRNDVGARVINEIEPNGSMTLADLLSQNGTTFRGVNSSKSDMDVFRINVPSNVTIRIILSPEYNLDLDYYLLGLYTSSDVLVAAATISSNSLVLNYRVTLAATFYLWVMYSNDSPYSSGDSYTGYIYWE